MDSENKKVGVALSGGIDSAVAALLLLKSGYQVIGHHFIQDASSGKGMEHSEDVKRVCEVLGIPLVVHDVSKPFERVKHAFFSSYAHGRTPNPCILCNRVIKFGYFLDKVLETGAEKYATGHYARIRVEENTGPRLFCSRDMRRDQSYFLAWVPRERLRDLVLPLGNKEKGKTANLAKRNGLGWLMKKEHSMEVCFVGKDYRESLGASPYGFGRAGKIITWDGRVLGEHNGIGNFTIGQRKGLPPWKEPLFVLAIDLLKGDVVVGPKKALERRNFHVAGVNRFFRDGDQELEGITKIRNTSKGIKSTWRFLPNHRAHVSLACPATGLSPRPLAVLYIRREVIASGIIQPYNP